MQHRAKKKTTFYFPALIHEPVRENIKVVFYMVPFCVCYLSMVPCGFCYLSGMIVSVRTHVVVHSCMGAANFCALGIRRVRQVAFGRCVSVACEFNAM